MFRRGGLWSLVQFVLTVAVMLVVGTVASYFRTPVGSEVGSVLVSAARVVIEAVRRSLGFFLGLAGELAQAAGSVFLAAVGALKWLFGLAPGGV